MDRNGDFKGMRMLFVWSGLNGYMGYCWRELSVAPRCRRVFDRRGDCTIEKLFAQFP